MCFGECPVDVGMIIIIYDGNNITRLTVHYSSNNNNNIIVFLNTGFIFVSAC